MATASSNQAGSIVKYGTLRLETKAGHKPNYCGVVMIDGMLLVVDFDEKNLQVYNSHDGKLIFTSYRLESYPRDICRISKTEVAVCLDNGTIVIMSLKSIDDFKLVKTLKTVFRYCYSFVKWHSDKLVVSGEKDGILCWGILSISDGHMDLTHAICQGFRTNMAIKDNTVYISCRTFDSTTKGVYAYNILNPHTLTFLYQHQELDCPGSIMTDRDCVYLCDRNKIHHLTRSGQLVTIHTVPEVPNGIFYDDQHGLLYTTSLESNEITVYNIKSLHQQCNSI